MRAERLLSAEVDRETAEVISETKRITQSGKDEERQPNDVVSKKSGLVDGILQLIDSGASDDVLSKFILASSSQGAALSFGAQGQNQGISITDLITFAKAITPAPPVAPQSDPEVKAILKTLADNDAKRTEAQIQAIKEQNAAMLKKIETPTDGAGGKPRVAKIFKASGEKVMDLEEGDVFILPQAESGDSIEKQKEKNRHDEEMARVANEKGYKDSIATSVADVAGAVVTFAGEKAVEAGNKEKPAPQEETAHQVFECGKCKTQFSIVPGTVRFKCPHCGEPYSSVPGEWAAEPEKGSNEAPPKEAEPQE